MTTTRSTPCPSAARTLPPLRLAAFLLAAAGLLVAAAPAQKPELDKLQRIKDWGYAIRPIKGWSSIPANAEERFIVGRWKMDLSEKYVRGDYEGWSSGQHCELTVVRIPLTGPTTGETAETAAAKSEKEGEEDPLATLRKARDPENLDEFIEGRWPGADKRWTRKVFKAGKLTGDLIEFSADAKAVVIAAFRKDNVDWGVVYTAFEARYRKDWQALYLKSLQSFQLFEGASPELTTGTRADMSKLEGDAKREALKASIAGNPGWYAIDTPNYVFLSNCADRGFIESLARDVEIIRRKMYVKMFPPRNKADSLSPVRVLSNEGEYYQYGGPPGSAGYFSPDTGELVLFVKFDDHGKSTSMELCRSVMFHEAFHQYVHYAIGDVSPHSWFNEGHGDYFAGATVAGGNVAVKPFDWRVRYLREHLQGGRDLIPLRSLVRFPQREYYTNAGLKYAQGWAFIYWLREVTRNKRNQQILDIYFQHVADNIEAFQQEKKKEGEGGETEGERVPGIPGVRVVNFKDRARVEKILSEAVDKAFEGVDLEAMDKEFREWVKRL